MYRIVFIRIQPLLYLFFVGGDHYASRGIRRKKPRREMIVLTVWILIHCTCTIILDELDHYADGLDVLFPGFVAFVDGGKSVEFTCMTLDCVPLQMLKLGLWMSITQSTGRLLMEDEYDMFRGISLYLT